jgi:hypothetical protein
MITLSICMTLAIAISAAARLLGASKKVAVVLAIAPMVVLLIRLAWVGGLELGPHGGFIPAWITVAIGLAIAVAPATVVTIIVKGNDSAGDDSST